jgi:hypothetical protein
VIKFGDFNYQCHYFVSVPLIPVHALLAVLNPILLEELTDDALDSLNANHVVSLHTGQPDQVAGLATEGDEEPTEKFIKL